MDLNCPKIKISLEWLEKQGLMGQFEKNFDEEFYNKYAPDSTKENLVFNAFDWKITSEGVNFWNDVCTRLERHLENPTPLHRFLAGIEEG